MAPEEEEKGSQVRLPGGGGSLAVKEGNEWQAMSICQGADTKAAWPSFLKPNALAFLFQPQTEVRDRTRRVSALSTPQGVQSPWKR